MSAPVLAIERLGVLRDGRELLRDVSLDVASGSVHCLIGPNGAGKSTLFHAVLGLVEFAGRICFGWRGPGRIGYVPQAFTVDRTLPLTVGEFLALARQRRPVCLGVGRSTRRRLQALLAAVGLDRFLDHPLGALSGGELQRVLLANAIDPTPELLLLDEAGSGLDEGAVRRFEAIVVEHARAHTTAVLMVSHDLAQVRRLADHVTVLDREVQRSCPAAEIVGGDLAGAQSPA